MKKVYIKPSATFVEVDQRDIIATSTNTFSDFGEGVPGEPASSRGFFDDNSYDWSF